MIVLYYPKTVKENFQTLPVLYTSTKAEAMPKVIKSILPTALRSHHFGLCNHYSVLNLDLQEKSKKGRPKGGFTDSGKQGMREMNLSVKETKAKLRWRKFITVVTPHG